MPLSAGCSPNERVEWRGNVQTVWKNTDGESVRGRGEVVDDSEHNNTYLDNLGRQLVLLVAMAEATVLAQPPGEHLVKERSEWRRVQHDERVEGRRWWSIWEEARAWEETGKWSE